MNYCLVFVIVLHFIKCVLPALLNKEEGAECRVENDVVWTCQVLSECPQVGDFKRSRPDICGFKEKVPVICCPPNEGASGNSGVRLPDANSEIKPQEEDIVIEHDETGAGESVPASSVYPSRLPLSMKKCIEYELKLCQSSFFNRDTQSTIIRSIREAKWEYHPVVLGGTPAVEKQYPFMAIIGYGEEDNILWDCGGSILSERWILSAAHCAQSRIGKAKWVAFGMVDLNHENLKDISLPIIRIVLHPEYKTPLIYNDIALYETKYAVMFNAYVKPICLSPLPIIPPNATAAGWGTTDFGGAKSSNLLFVELDTVDTLSCKHIYNTSRLIPRGIDVERMICAGGFKKDTCTGDSGGPLYYQSSICLHVQIGVVSFGRRCGVYPGVYSKISYYLPWIENIVWPDDKVSEFFNPIEITPPPARNGFNTNLQTKTFFV